MYLKRFAIDSIKCFDHLEIDFPQDERDFAGWVVLLGGNGVGKSTLLQAMALTLLGPIAGQRLFQPEGWVRANAKKGSIQAEIIRAESDSQLGQPRKKPYEVNFAVTGKQEVEIDGQPYDQPQLVHLADHKERKSLVSGPYAAKRPGWFSCGYGPFRRLSGGDTQAKVVYSPGREARFATLFFESAALTQCEDWLTGLYSRSLDPMHADREKAAADLEVVRTVIDRLLPGNVRLDRIDSEHVYFRTTGGVSVSIPDLSDGYRSFLALAIDMWTSRTKGGHPVTCANSPRQVPPVRSASQLEGADSPLKSRRPESCPSGSEGGAASQGSFPPLKGKPRHPALTSPPP